MSRPVDMGDVWMMLFRSWERNQRQPSKRIKQWMKEDNDKGIFWECQK